MDAAPDPNSINAPLQSPPLNLSIANAAPNPSPTRGIFFNTDFPSPLPADLTATFVAVLVATFLVTFCPIFVPIFVPTFVPNFFLNDLWINFLVTLNLFGKFLTNLPNFKSILTAFFTTFTSNIIGPAKLSKTNAPNPPRTHFQCLAIKSKNPLTFSRFAGSFKNSSAPLPSIPNPIIDTNSFILSKAPMIGCIIFCAAALILFVDCPLPSNLPSFSATSPFCLLDCKSLSSCFSPSILVVKSVDITDAISIRILFDSIRIALVFLT